MGVFGGAVHASVKVGVTVNLVGKSLLAFHKIVLRKQKCNPDKVRCSCVNGAGHHDTGQGAHGVGGNGARPHCGAVSPGEVGAVIRADFGSARESHYYNTVRCAYRPPEPQVKCEVVGVAKGIDAVFSDG